MCSKSLSHLLLLTLHQGEDLFEPSRPSAGSNRLYSRFSTRRQVRSAALFSSILSMESCGSISPIFLGQNIGEAEGY